MFLHKRSFISSLRLTTITLAAALATTLPGCSSNPDPIKYAEPAPSQPPASSISGSAVTTSSEPTLVRINEPVPLAQGHPDEYVVQIGDTLWDIAATFLKDPWYWPEIWYVNPEIENPHLIYPGDTLGLVTIDGQPRVTNVRASTYRMSPEARVTPLTEAVSSIPYESVSAFLTTGVVLEKSQVVNLPYLLATRGDHMIASAGNEIYVRGLGNQPVGSRYSVVHIGEKLVDPDDNRLVGYQGIWVGEGIMRRGGDPATVALTDTTQEAIEGDRLIPESVVMPLNFYPKAPNGVIDGRIISVVNGVTQIGQYQVVVINRGARNGLAVGDVLTVFQAGEKVADRVSGGSARLPDEEAGTVMVFKVYDGIGYALVMEATQSIHILDAIRNPI
jgi:LysM domain